MRRDAFRATLRRADEGVRPYIETNLLQDDVSVWSAKTSFSMRYASSSSVLISGTRDTGFHWSNFGIGNAAFLGEEA